MKKRPSQLQFHADFNIENITDSEGPLAHIHISINHWAKKNHLTTKLGKSYICTRPHGLFWIGYPWNLHAEIISLDKKKFVK